MIRLARRFGIVTPYTSFLVTEDETQVAQPVIQGRAGGRDLNLDTPVTTTASTSAPTRRPARPAQEPAAPEAADGFGAFDTLAGGGVSANRAAPMAQSAPGATARHHGGPMPVAAAPPAPPPMAAPRPAAAAATGEAGRRLASNLRALREAERANNGAGNTRFASGRSFTLQGGVWREQGNEAAGARVLRVPFMSRAWFAVVRQRPALREALSLGERVRLRLDERRVIEVTSGGADLTDAEVEAFLR
ncbi:MAG: hypothetical protein R3A52_31910 [Polyangiales bacterium]